MGDNTYGFSAISAGKNLVEYAKEVKAATDTVAKRELPDGCKYGMGVIPLVYENYDKIEVAAKKVVNDACDKVKSNIKQSVENYDNASTIEKIFGGGLVTKGIVEVMRWFSEE